MNRRFVVATGLGLTAIFFLASGCASQPQPTPQPTPTENVIVVVVTSTTQPTLAPTDTQEATITPLATFTPFSLLSPTPTARPTSRPAPTKIPVASTPKAADTATLTPPAPTATPGQDKYPAPTGISPGAGDSNSDRADIQFKYLAVGPLGGNECYLLHVQMVVPNANVGGVAGDDFLDVKNCASQSPPGTRMVFVLFRPRFGSPTYAGIERLAGGFGGSSPWTVQWYVRVVQNNGLSPDGVHYNTIPLSPNSATLESVFIP